MKIRKVRLSPRRRITAGAAFAAAVAVAASPALLSGSAEASSTKAEAQSRPKPLSLPEPTGASHVGTISLRLVDRSRPGNPLVPGKSRGKRELAVQLWYPTRADGLPAARYVPARSGRFLDRANRLQPGTTGGIVTHGQRRAPIERGDAHPVVVLSPGAVVPRAFYTSFAEDLASHGFVVVAMDYTHETTIVEFPGGRLVPGSWRGQSEADALRAVRVRVADTHFVLDWLERANRDGGRFGGQLDLSRIGMAGHSLGGATAAAAMFGDRRIDAGINLDGSLFGSVVERGLDRPFMVMTSPRNEADRSVRKFLSRSTRQHVALTLAGSEHITFSDLPLLRGVLPAQFTESLGSIDGVRAIAIQRAYLLAFLHAHLRGTDEPLLAGPSARYPEVRFRN